MDNEKQIDRVTFGINKLAYKICLAVMGLGLVLLIVSFIFIVVVGICLFLLIIFLLLPRGELILTDKRLLLVLTKKYLYLDH